MDNDHLPATENTPLLSPGNATESQSDAASDQLVLSNHEAQRVNPWTKSAFVLYACAAVAFCCSCGNGYDGSLMTAINGMPYYQRKFHQGELGVETGIIFSIYTVGQMVGALIASPVNDRFGRRAGMFAGCLTIMLGSAVISSANILPQFIFGRFILGVGISGAVTAAPTYVVEISPPQWRGRMTALYNTGWSAGAIPAAAICLGTSRWQSDWSWRLPLILQALPATIVVMTIWLLPESPRWLYMKGRKEEVLEFLSIYHGNGDAEHPLVTLQIAEFNKGISQTGADKRWWDYRALIATKNARWRALMVLLMAICGQMTGNGLGYFNLDIYKSLGFTTRMQFYLNLFAAMTQASSAIIAVSLTDLMPRRRVLIIGTALCSFALAGHSLFSGIWASYGDGPKNLTVGKLAAGFFFLFGGIYGFTYTPLQALYPAECLETTTRAKGMSMKIFVINIANFFNLFFIPIFLKRLGWHFMLLFVVWDAIESLLWYRFAVETQGFTLEELDGIFSSPNPVRASLDKRNRLQS